MTRTDDKNLARIAKFATVEYRVCDRDGASGDWITLPNARVLSVTLSAGLTFNEADIEISDTRWNETRSVLWGYLIRIRYSSTVLFQGFVVSFPCGYSTAVVSGGEQPSAKEWLKIHCKDYRWIYSRCSPVYGQVARGVDDAAEGTTATLLTGQELVFNPSGVPNRDPNTVTFSEWYDYSGEFITHVFFNPKVGGNPWTAGSAIIYLLSPIYNRIPAIIAGTTPLAVPGLDHTDFDTVLNEVNVEKSDAVSAINHICDSIGWTFREEYYYNGGDSQPRWVFYKSGIASGAARVYTQGGYNPCILHTLHTPAVGEDIAEAVQVDGAKMVAALDLTEDIDPVVNQPWLFGSPHQFEITAELVPAWQDTDLHYSSTSTGLFFTESELADKTDPNSLNFFKYHHSAGDSFLRNAGRKWALNESGLYTGTAGGYDRGDVFDFSTDTGIPSSYIKPSSKRLYAPFNRRFLPCLTLDKESVNSTGIRLQWSFDGGTTWQELLCPFEILADEAAIRLTIPNLSEIVDIKHAKFTSGSYTGVEINYFTSLADDLNSGRGFKPGSTTRWNTRVRITATIQLDQRLYSYNSTVYSGSPFVQAKIYDLANKYWLSQRCSSSSFYSSGLIADAVDDTSTLSTLLTSIRQANEDMAIHGLAVLDRLWFDGTDIPSIALGDSVNQLTGRNYPLGQTLGSRTVYPEIVQIQYMIQSQKQMLLLRDPRLAIQMRDSTHRRKHR